MKRWSNPLADYVEDPKVDAFLVAVVKVCEEHGLWLGHEDEHGRFLVCKDDNSEWLLCAAIDGRK